MTSQEASTLITLIVIVVVAALVIGALVFFVFSHLPEVWEAYGIARHLPQYNSS